MYDAYTNFDSTRGDLVTDLAVGEIHTGKIYAISSDYISIDIGYRELVYVKFEKEPKEIQALKPGEETSVLITTYDGKSHVAGSISGGVKQKVFMDLRDAVETGNTAWIGKITSMIENGGYMVAVQGIDCFMPGSLAGINKLHDFTSIIGTEMYVVPVSFSPERGTLVVSHRKYLQALIPQEIQSLKDNPGQEITGSVTGTAKYGVFVEFNNCLTGMIHTNDLDEDTMNKFKARQVLPGDEISFIVKDVISDTKITLTQKANASVNPWHDIASRYQIPSTVIATVKTKKDYGLFITIEEGVTGLLHVSEVGEDVMDVFKNGDSITVQITRIDVESMKVFLKMPQ
jgi:small subunit ribosomal protein S1